VTLAYLRTCPAHVATPTLFLSRAIEVIPPPFHSTASASPGPLTPSFHMRKYFWKAYCSVHLEVSFRRSLFGPLVEIYIFPLSCVFLRTVPLPADPLVSGPVVCASALKMSPSGCCRSLADYPFPGVSRRFIVSSCLVNAIAGSSSCTDPLVVIAGAGPSRYNLHLLPQVFCRHGIKSPPPLMSTSVFCLFTCRDCLALVSSFLVLLIPCSGHQGTLRHPRSLT